MTTITVPNANKVVEYFERNSDIYENIFIHFIDFDKIEISVNEPRTIDEAIELIENIIYSAKLS